MRQATELSVGVVFRILWIFLGGAWKPQLVSFTHGPPKNRCGGFVGHREDAWRRLLRCTALF
jgi:hypothetical protein